jgi:hypothetical protein
MRNVCICGRHTECGNPLCPLLADASRGILLSVGDDTLLMFDPFTRTVAQLVEHWSDKLLNFAALCADVAHCTLFR